jgi:hypothetical protein
MTPYQLLQIPLDADERAVKRAYAGLLKQTRPDDDAEAFQRLQEAYGFCLARAKTRHRQQGRPESTPARATPHVRGLGADPVDSPAPRSPSAGTSRGECLGELGCDCSGGVPAADAGPSTSPPPRERAFDTLLFSAELHRLLAIPDPRQMRTWLYAQEALYSVQLKHALRPVVVKAIHDAPNIAAPNVLDTLVDFFGLNSLDRDGLAQQLQIVLDIRRRKEILDRAVRAIRMPNREWVERRIGHELSGSGSPLWRLFLLLVPGTPSRVLGILTHLRRIDPRLQHPALAPGAVAFWDQVLDQHALRRPRLVMAMSRIVVWLSMLFGFAALLLGEVRGQLPITLAGWTLSLAGLWFAYALIRIGWGKIGLWCERRLRLPDGAFSSLLFAGIGVGLSWIPGLGPLPALIGLLIGYLRSLRAKQGWVVGMILAAVLISLMGWWIATERFLLSLGPDHRMALVCTLAALPLPVQFWLARMPRSAKWSHWTAMAFAVLALLAGQVS